MIVYASTPAPVATLEIVSRKSKDRLVSEPPEAIFGGYANARSEIFLFGQDVVYRVNFKNRTVQQRPKLNPAAQARYDATEAGDAFEYCNVSFRRLSEAEITEICASGAFRVTPKLLA
ncbi:MAG TPA: hypothetical protein VGF86_05560 [Candidatus Tumulicola sp.]|jgi:hypothetical protein